MRRALKRGPTLSIACRTMSSHRRGMPSRIAIVKGRDDFVFRATDTALPRRPRQRHRSRPNRAAVDQPSIPAGVAFSPPPIADADLRYAVDGRLHPARATGLERLARVVQPHVASLDQEVRDVQIVVVDERDAAGEHRIGRALVDLLEVMFARFVRGMRFAGEDDLDRPARRVQNPEQPVGVAEDQLWPLVAGEPARETDRQRVGIEQRSRGDDARGGDVFFFPARAGAFPDEREQVLAQRLARGPEILVRDLEDPVPDDGSSWRSRQPASR